MSPSPIAPFAHKTLHERLAEHIEELILNGDMPAGQPIPSERELAERFQVSRSAVRDAVRMLAARGLVEVRHGVGNDCHRERRRAVSGVSGALVAARPLFAPGVARSAPAHRGATGGQAGHSAGCPDGGRAALAPGDFARGRGCRRPTTGRQRCAIWRFTWPWRKGAAIAP